MQSAARVGLLGIVFIVLIVAAMAILRQSLFTPATQRYFIVFEDAGGLTDGAKVLMSGVRVGTVSEVRLEGAQQAVAVIDIEEDYKIPEGSVAELPGSLISLGDREVHIMPGEGPGDMAPESRMAGHLASPLKDLLPDTDQTINEVNKTLVALREVLEDKELTDGIKDLIKQSENTAAQFGRVASTADRAIAQNSERFGVLLASAGESLENMEQITAEVQHMVANNQIEEKTYKLLDTLEATAQEGKNLVAEIRDFVNDPELRRSINRTMANVDEVTASSSKIAKDFEQVSTNAITVSEETVTLMQKANKLADEIQELIASFKETVEKFSTPASLLTAGIETEASITYVGAGENRLRADANIFIPTSDGKLMIGMYDAFESNKLNVMLQKDFSDDLGLRYGVYAGQPGIGVDYRVAPRASLRGDLFGLNDTQLDLRLRYGLGNGIDAWLGLERVFGDNRPSLGIGIRR